MLHWECSTTRARKYLQFLAAHHSSIPGSLLIDVLSSLLNTFCVTQAHYKKIISQKSSDLGVSYQEML